MDADKALGVDALLPKITTLLSLVMSRPAGEHPVLLTAHWGTLAQLILFTSLRVQFAFTSKSSADSRFGAGTINLLPSGVTASGEKRSGPSEGTQSATWVSV